jgi:hypothetical protein
METKHKRPVSVWIAQIILFVCGLLSLLSLSVTVLWLFGNRGGAGFLIFLFPMVFSLALAALYLGGFYGMATRRAWGRWTGIAALSLVVIGSLYSQVYRVTGPMQYYEYKNGAERFGGFIGGAIVFGLFLWLVLHLAFSKRVTEFFSPFASPEIEEPPPPPTFGD